MTRWGGRGVDNIHWICPKMMTLLRKGPQTNCGTTWSSSCWSSCLRPGKELKMFCLSSKHFFVVAFSRFLAFFCLSICLSLLMWCCNRSHAIYKWRSFLTAHHYFALVFVFVIVIVPVYLIGFCIKSILSVDQLQGILLSNLIKCKEYYCPIGSDKKNIVGPDQLQRILLSNLINCKEYCCPARSIARNIVVQADQLQGILLSNLIR